nr:KrmN [uncultured bacterium]
MSTTAELLAQLSSLGIKLWDDDGYLGYSAPKGALTPALRAELAAHKADILELLRQSERAAPAPSVGRAPEPRFPLSYGQQALWVLYQQAPESPAFNMGVSLHIQTPLEVDALRWALQSLAGRHAALRTTFSIQDGLLTQDIQASHDLVLETVDAAALTWDDLMEQVYRASQRPFDLERGPVFRATLFRAAPPSHILLLNLHHIAGDAASFGILMADLQALYTQKTRGQAADLPALETTYADYVRWESSLLASSAGARLAEYWTQQLAGELPVLDLPTDRPRPAVRTYQGASYTFTLSPALSAQLKTLVQAEQTTLFSLLLAAFQLLLHRYTGQDEVWVGSPSGSGRSQPAFAGIVGYLINPLVFRARFPHEPELTFRQFLQQARQTVFEALEHQAYPFPLLVQQLQPVRHASYTPLFQTFFVFDSSRLDTASQVEGDLPMTPLGLDQMEGQFDLTLTLTDGERLLGALRYNADLFDTATVARMAGHFEPLLAGIVTNPDQPLHTLPLLTEAEQHQLLVAWNDTHVPFEPGACVHHWVEQQAQRTPHAMAIEYEGQQLTYDAFNQRANQLAHFLRQRGVGPETRVGICLERSVEMIVALLGICKSGGAYVPLDPAYPRDRLAFMMQDSQMRLLVTQTSLLEQLPIPDGLPQMVCLDRDWPHIATMPSDNPVVQVAAEQLAYIIYTSGSSGAPKAVMVPHRGLRNLVSWYHRVFDVNASDHTMQFANLIFDASALDIWPTLCRGATLHIVKPELMSAPQRLQDWLIQLGITIAHTPTVITEQLMAMTWPENATLRLLITGGEQLHVPGTASPLPFEVVNNYGPTENSVASTWYVVPPDSPAIPPIGRALDNQSMYVVDGHLQPVPVGVAGELYVGGVGVSRGYLNQPGLTAEKFVPNPFAQGRLYRTGDLVRYLPDGNLEFLGRIDNQIKLRGFRIELGEIESALRQYPGVWECVVAVREQTAGSSKQLVAYLVPDAVDPSIKDDQATEIRAHLSHTLPDYMVPTAYVILDALPLTASGKVDMRALPAPERADLQLHIDFAPPRTPTETRLAAMWTQVLGVDRIGIHDHFFELGGHSLLATRLLAEIETQLGKKLPLSSLFEAPTIAELAPLLIEAPPPQPWSPVVPIQPTGNNPNLFCLPGGAAHVFYFWDLARRLGAEQPFYGLQPPGYEEDTAPLNRMADFVSLFLENLQQIQPQGPYLLGGHSSGAYIAMALVLALQRQGQAVPAMVILDTIPPGMIPDGGPHVMRNSLADVVRIAKEGLADRLPIDIETLETLSGDAAWQYVVDGYKQINFLPPQAGVAQLKRMHDMYTGVMQAIVDYRPEDHYEGQLLFFQTHEITIDHPEDMAAGWQGSAPIPSAFIPFLETIRVC